MDAARGHDVIHEDREMMIELEGRGFAFLAEVFVIYCRLWRHSGIDQVCASWPSPANLRLNSQKRPTAQAL